MKEQLESTFSKSAVKPIYRTKIGTHDVYIADGFLEAKQLPIIQRKFGSAISGNAQAEFPHGCYATVWFAEGKIASRGGISLCKPDHDIETLDTQSRQKARVNFAVNAARDALIGKKLH